MPTSESPTSVKCSLKMAEGTLKMPRSYRKTVIRELCQEEAGVPGREGTTDRGQGDLKMPSLTLTMKKGVIDRR